jgi:hypothetical protein
MRRHLVLAILVGMFSIALILDLGFCSQLPVDDDFSLYGNSDVTFSNDYNIPLTKGDTVSINISVAGDPVTFGIANASGWLYGTKSNVSFLQTTWSVPYNDTYTFHFGNGGGPAYSQVHFEAALVAQVPEYQLTSILVEFMIAMLLVAIFIKQKHARKGQQSTTIANGASNLRAVAQDCKKPF